MLGLWSKLGKIAVHVAEDGFCCENCSKHDSEM